jgi:hypothetical protein
MANFVIKLDPKIIHISPMGFHRYASEFLSASRGLKTDHLFSPVPYYLICRSIELSLKSYLLAKGVSEKEFRQKKHGLGHDLVNVFQKAQYLGLESIVEVSPNQQMELTKANEYYVCKGFEYFQVVKAATGYQGLPELSVLQELAGVLVDGLKNFCMEATDGPL